MEMKKVKNKYLVIRKEGYDTIIPLFSEKGDILPLPEEVKRIIKNSTPIQYCGVTYYFWNWKINRGAQNGNGNYRNNYRKRSTILHCNHLSFDRYLPVNGLEKGG